MEANIHEMHTVEREEPVASEGTGFQSFDSRTMILHRFYLLILTVVNAVGFIAASLIQWVSGVPFWIIGIVISVGIVITLSLLWTALRWPRLAYDRYRWKLDAVGLQVQRGVIWHHQLSIPIARVQHADVSQGPLQRRYELGTLTIHTAGTENASIPLPGFTHEKAVELRDKLVAQKKSGHVV